MKYARRDATIYTDLEPIDRNDPDSANSAIEYGLPTGFSGKAHACWEYFSGAAYLFEYKGQLVITDESLELTEYGDGSHEAPFGAPRGTFDTCGNGPSGLYLVIRRSARVYFLCLEEVRICEN